jgi:hypothetical protein
MGDSHYIETSQVAQSIEAFNAQLREEGHDSRTSQYEQRENSYVGDIQSGDYTSDYKRIQIDNAIKRINKQISHMKPSSDGRVYAPDEDASGMAMDMAPSGSESYRSYYIKEMARRVIGDDPGDDDTPYQDQEMIHSRTTLTEPSEAPRRRRRRKAVTSWTPQ